MTLRLIAHPDAAPHPFALDAEAVVSGPRQLLLSYELRGPIDTVVIPPPAAGADRRDGLWQSTCFEAFIRGRGDRYLELNLSPSTAWAAYAFAFYRGDPAPPPIARPAIAIEQEAGLLRLSAAIDLAAVDLLEGQDRWKLNLSAVIETIDGARSYWALRHPPEKPDFHHPDCFALELPAPEAA